MGLLIVFGVIFVGIFVGVFLYYGARYMKGKLTLELSRSTVSSGEPLSGRVNLTVKKSIRGLLQVSLIGREKRRSRNNRGTGSSSGWSEVYRQDHILEETRDFTMGLRQNYEFEIVVPTSAEARQHVATLHAAAEEMGDGVMAMIELSYFDSACNAEQGIAIARKVATASDALSLGKARRFWMNRGRSPEY